MFGLKSSTCLYLKSDNQVHPFPFLESVIEITVKLCSDSGRIIPGITVPFTVCMQYKDDSKILLNNAVEVINPQAMCVNGSIGQSPIVRVRLLECSGNRDVVLAIVPGENIHQNVMPYLTRPMQVVRYRMEITNEDNIPPTFFKDEGGKGNQIVLMIRLVNSVREAIVGRSGTRLKCQLHYDDGDMVEDQSILKISEDTRMYVDPNGCATIKCRIEQISGNHAGRKFKVYVIPDIIHNPMCADISHIWTPEVLVKSKISKKNREKRLLMQQQEEEEQCATDIKRRKCSGDTVQCISPANFPGEMRSGGVEDVNNRASLEMFAEFTARQLEKLQHQLQLQQQSVFCNSTIVEPTKVIGDILQLYQSLGLSTQPEEFPDIDNELKDFPQSEADDGTDFFDSYVNNNSDSIMSRPTALAGPDAKRAPSMFSQAAASIGAAASRGHSLSLLDIGN